MKGEKRRLVVIGASYLQVPLLKTARRMGLETHAFAWESGAVGRDWCDYYYPVSIVEKDEILEHARLIKPHGVVSIGSDLAVGTVAHVANALELVGNSVRCAVLTTDKLQMRRSLKDAGLPCPRFAAIEPGEVPDLKGWCFPLIVKPPDRSGSRGVTRVDHPGEIDAALETARSESFGSTVLLEEFVTGRELSIEMISWRGEHHFLATTDKVTTGAPHFVELAHHQPADLPPEIERRVVEATRASLGALGVEVGASHSEVILTPQGEVVIVEIGSRMGGDHIGAELVRLSTGYDFVEGVIGVALGEFRLPRPEPSAFAGVYYVHPEPGEVREVVDRSANFPEVVAAAVFVSPGDRVETLRESSQRAGYFLYRSGTDRFLPRLEDVLEIRTVPDE